jgi:hypothetical protein
MDHNIFDKVEAVASRTSFLSSGVPELTELIIALGSSGAFVAIQAILKSYFAKRPKSELFLETKDHGKSSRIAVRNADRDVLKSFFDHLNQQL